MLGFFSAMEMHRFACQLFTRDKLHVWISLGLVGFWFLLGLIAGQPWIPLGASVVQILMGFLYAFGGKRTELNRSDAGEILALRRYLRSIDRPEAARLLKADPEKVFNASTCGDNCAPFILKLAKKKNLTINLRHLMDFGKKKFPVDVKVLNTGDVVHSMEELMPIAFQFV